MDERAFNDRPSLLIASALDPGGGAGLLMDVRAAMEAGAVPAVALTGIVVQDGGGVDLIHPVPAGFFVSSLHSVQARHSPRVAKAGALISAGIVKALADHVREMSLKLVCDPVTVASGGGALAAGADPAPAIVEHLLPVTSLLTPNLGELAALAALSRKGVPGPGGFTSDDDVTDACRELCARGCGAVLVTGGHAGGEGVPSYSDDGPSLPVTDVLFIPAGDGTGEKVFRFPRARQDADPHGTGCAMASLVAGSLALALHRRLDEGPLPDGLLVGSVTRASWTMGTWMRAVVWEAGPGGMQVMDSPDWYGGTSPRVSERGMVIPDGLDASTVSEMLDRYAAGLSEVMGLLDSGLMPEVGSNMSYAAPGAKSPEEVLALDSRVVRKGEDAPVTCGQPEWGGSHHTARIALAAMDADPEFRCALNVRYRGTHVRAAREAGLTVSSFSRSEEPPDVSSMEWGTARAIAGFGGGVPDVVFDEGGQGKEPMIRLLGKDPPDVASKLRRLVGKL